MTRTRRPRPDRSRLTLLLALTLGGLAGCSSGSGDGAGAQPDGGSQPGPGTDGGGHPQPGTDAGGGPSDAGAEAAAHDGGSHDAAADTGSGPPGDAGGRRHPRAAGLDAHLERRVRPARRLRGRRQKWTQETGNSGWRQQPRAPVLHAGDGERRHPRRLARHHRDPQGAAQLQCQYGTCEYTSARMNTAGKFEQTYGRFEARIQMPTGQGIWPAFWVLGNDIGRNVGWPQCGEIDIMENIGSTPSTNYGSLHGPGYSGGQDITGSYSLPGGAILADDYHLFALEWDAERR